MPLDKDFHLGTEASISDNSKLVDFIQKGTLKFHLKKLDMNLLCYMDEYFLDKTPIVQKIIDDPDNVIIVDLMRTDEIDSSQNSGTKKLTLDDFRGKNEPFIKKYSKPTFKKESFDLINKLKSIGYKVILGEPSDKRRYRTYSKLGMKKVRANNSYGEYLYYDLDSIEK